MYKLLKSEFKQHDMNDIISYCYKNNKSLEKIDEEFYYVSDLPSKTNEQIINELRSQREFLCFRIVNRGKLWYDTLTEEQKTELQNWYDEWLDVTASKLVPTSPSWLK